MPPGRAREHEAHEEASPAGQVLKLEALEEASPAGQVLKLEALEAQSQVRELEALEEASPKRSQKPHFFGDDHIGIAVNAPAFVYLRCEAIDPPATVNARHLPVRL